MYPAIGSGRKPRAPERKLLWGKVAAWGRRARGLIERDHAAPRYALTDQGRAVLGALVASR